MDNQSDALPQATPDVESAMALVCTIPPSARGERQVSVHAVISQAASGSELENGVAFVFDNSDDMAQLLLDLVLAERNCCAQFSYSIHFGPRHQLIELRVQALGQLVQPLKDLYRGLARNTDSNARNGATGA